MTFWFKHKVKFHFIFNFISIKVSTKTWKVTTQKIKESWLQSVADTIESTGESHVFSVTRPNFRGQKISVARFRHFATSYIVLRQCVDTMLKERQSKSLCAEKSDWATRTAFYMSKTKRRTTGWKKRVIVFTTSQVKRCDSRYLTDLPSMQATSATG